MNELLIELRHVERKFNRNDKSTTVLKDVNLRVDSGEFVSFMGPSGSGKSTLLNILAGIDRPSSGEARILGRDLSAMTEDQLASWRNQHVGFVFQQFYLIPVLTAFENVELPLLLTPLNQVERREHVLASLELVGLAEHVNHYPRELSGGQEQRISIARAIVTDPTFVLADEPTGDLDAESATEILEVLKTLNRDCGKSIIMVTHDPRADQFASVHYYIDKGCLRQRPAERFKRDDGELRAAQV